MLSILITYYNQEKYVSRSLDSVFSQKIDEDFEVLIGDDGSTDETCKIVNDYSTRYPGKIRLFTQPRDNNKKYNPVERASKNRLTLLKNAKGNYVCFLDGDDKYCDFDWLQESIDILKLNDKIIGVAHNYKETYENGTENYPEGIKKYTYITAKHYCKNIYTHVGTILFRNSFNAKDYEKLISLKSFDDNDITFYFLNYGDLYCVDKVVYSYYQNNGSIWNSTNNLEKEIINSIDYEIVKQILRKYHTLLLIKYSGSLFYCYKNRKELNNINYEKYKNQCLDSKIMDKLLNWYNQTKLEKTHISIVMFYIGFIYFCTRVIRKINNIFHL